jgi:tRNA nucleotidyltransferase/poly(A) polymerase
VLLNSGISIDFAPLRAATLREDQLLRDFSINAMAVPLQLDDLQQNLIDPCGGLADLQNKLIVDCSPRSIPDDPLRMLKGIRHAVALGFALADETVERIKENAALLAETAGERVREELCRILAEDIGQGLELLQTTGLLRIVTGINRVSHNAVQLLGQLDRQLTHLERGGYLHPGEKGTVATRTLILLAELLRLEGSTDLKQLLHQRLRFSKQQQQLMIGLQQQIHEQIFSGIKQLDNSRRKALFYEQWQPYAYEKLLRWGLCNGILELDALTDLQQAFNGLERGGRVPDLMNGHSLLKHRTQLHPQQIGHWLQRIKDAERNGIISSEKEAKSWLDQQLAIDR